MSGESFVQYSKTKESMKVLSLSQPWASLLFLDSPTREGKVKQWETRGWRPSADNHRKLLKEGFLIHASKTWKPEQRELIKKEPFAPLMNIIEPMPFGAIIGWVMPGRILTTEQWLKEQPKIPSGTAVRWDNEVWFGDYSDGRCAWEIVETKLFAYPIENVKGALSLWDYEMDSGTLRTLTER